MQTTPTKQERYLAASAYLFEIAYDILLYTYKESEFTKFHHLQEKKIIRRILIPGLVITFGAILWETVATKPLIYIGIITILISFLFSITGAIFALKGVKKKII